jgi:2'-5' RNA ligase
MRLFIASPVSLYDYTGLQKEFSAVLEGKWVEEESLHLTWVFLGEQPDAGPWMEKLRKLTPLEERPPLRKLGSFGRPPRVFHAKAEDSRLYAKARQFREAGFQLHRFTPHVTLCRIKKIHDWRRYKELLKAYEEKTVGEILEEINLYESVLTKERAIHQKIAGVTT